MYVHKIIYTKYIYACEHVKPELIFTVYHIYMYLFASEHSLFCFECSGKIVKNKLNSA